jgi:hypothetical protein
MIYEYALDPGVLRDWHVFKHLAEGFEMSRGRMIVRYPKDWLRLAYHTVETLDDNAKKKFVTWLADRAMRALTTARAGAQPFGLATWFDNAVAEHKRMPFHAIIADQPTSDDPPVLRFSDVDYSAALWAVGTQKFIARSVTDIAQRAAPLLAHATAIRFIDPYFKGNPDQISILIGCLSRCVAGGKTSIVSIELHVDGRQVQPPTEQYLRTTLGGKWPLGLPHIQIVRWKADYLHNRFILTDRGGIILGDSLRQHRSRPDQMTLMEDDTRTQWWKHHDASLHPSQVCKPGEQG